MKNITEQMEYWAGEFGEEYTDRNPQTPEEMDAAYMSNYGVSRTEMNSEFLGPLPRSIKILEVGSNVGAQLLCLQKMGFENLYGIEINQRAIEITKSRTRNINTIHGSGFDLPFKDGYFDLVFTSGVLIHISPSDSGRIMDEIYRCTKKNIWGFEYFAEEYMEVAYRGKTNLLWKANFSKLYMERFKDLALVKERRYNYLNSNNTNSMFLLAKTVRE